MSASTLHIVIGDAAEPVLRSALLQLGRSDSIAAYHDDLTFGPIDPPDPAPRADWIARELDAEGWAGFMSDIEAFWSTVLRPWDRRILWVSRRLAREYAGFLECLWRLGEQPCEVVDLTDVMVTFAVGPLNETAQRRALCLPMLCDDDIIDNDLLRLASPLPDDLRAFYRDEWQRLRRENGALRVLARELRLTSVPLTHFDAALLSYIRPHWLKSARIIGETMARSDSGEHDIHNVGDFVLACRLHALASAGKIEAKGNLRRIRFSEVRLPPSTEEETGTA